MSRRWRYTSAEGSTRAIFASTCSAWSRSPALKKSCASSNEAWRRSSSGRSSRFTRSWCMRMARSTSPRRRKRLPSANCNSTVCGFSLATCRKDSIALSGCSFRRKLRPLKYDDGNARDSDSSDLRSTRAATQPMPKKTGRARSHQNSNSMGVGAGPGVRRQRHRHALLLQPPQPRELAALAHDGRDPREQPDDHSRHECHEEHEDERRLPALLRQAVHHHGLRVLDREPDEHEDDEEPEDPDEGLHWERGREAGRYCNLRGDVDWFGRRRGGEDSRFEELVPPHSHAGVA